MQYLRSINGAVALQQLLWVAGCEVLPLRFRVAGGCGSPLEPWALVARVVDMEIYGNIVCDVASLSISFHASGACLILDSFSFYQWEITINHPCPQTFGSTALSGVQGTLIKGPNLRDT